MAWPQIPPWMNIVLWIGLGYSMIMFNKILLTTWNFRYPFFLTAWHCVLATILTQTLARTTKLLPGVNEGKISITDFFRKVLPVAVLFAYGLVAGNLAYTFISLSYIQMLKAVTPVPMLLLSFLFGREKPSLAQLLIVIVVSFGVLLSSIGELEFNMIGFILQVTAVAGDCFRMIALDVLLRDTKLDSLSMLYYTAPPSALLIGLGFLIFEFPTFQVEMLTPTFNMILLANGLLAVSLNLAVFFLISNTSAMVMSISGPLKDILIVISSVIFFHTPVTIMQYIGFSISLFGLNLYRQYKAGPRALNENVADARVCLWNNACFMFHEPSYVPAVLSTQKVLTSDSGAAVSVGDIEMQERERLLNKPSAGDE